MSESLEDWIVREARAISGPRTHLQDSEALIQFGLLVAQRVARPAVVEALIAKWRWQADPMEGLEHSLYVQGWDAAKRQCADDLNAALLQAAAPPAPTAEPRRPLPPEVLADALQDRIGPTSGKLIRTTPVHAAPPERVSAESVEDWIVREARAIAGPRTHLQDSEAVIQFGLKIAAHLSAPAPLPAPQEDK